MQSRKITEDSMGSPDPQPRQRRRSGSGSAHRTRSRRNSFSSDPDSQERSFVYPCQAFKQFLLSMRDGNVNMADFANNSKIQDYMNSSQGGSTGGGDGTFQKSLRSGGGQGSIGRKKRS